MENEYSAIASFDSHGNSVDNGAAILQKLRTVQAFANIGEYFLRQSFSSLAWRNIP